MQVKRPSHSFYPQMSQIPHIGRDGVTFFKIVTESQGRFVCQQ